MADNQAFVATQVGDKGSLERRRADEFTDWVIKPVLEGYGLELVRADRDPTPGRITQQLLRSLLEARLVIADVTGRNANVYYELGVAHSFSLPVIMLVDAAKNVAFDTKDERLIEVGEYKEVLAVPQAEETKKKLHEAIKVVLSEDYVPSSLVADVAAARSIDQLAPENPLASELAAIREAVEEIRHLARPQPVIPPYLREERARLRALLERLAANGAVSPLDVNNLTGDATSSEFHQWVISTERTAEEHWVPPATRAPEPDDVPF